MCIRYIDYWGGRNSIVFLGDSRVRQLYFEFIQSLSLNDESKEDNQSAHHDLEYFEKESNMKVKFLWLPVVNRSMIDQFKRWNKQSLDERPNIIIAGSATHSIKQSNASLQALEYYRHNLTILLPYMDALNQTTKILWALQDPIKHDLLRKDREMITNEQIDAYNKVAIEVLHHSTTDSVYVWSSARLVAQGFKDMIREDENNDGLHVSANALRLSIQILWNLYCNDHMNYNDGTCCSDPEKSTIIQLIFLSVFSLFMGISISIYFYNRVFRKTRSTYRSYKWTKLHSKVEDDIELVEQSDANANLIDENGDANDDEIVQFETLSSSKERLADLEQGLSKKDLIILLSRLGVVMFYFYLCDRTNYFMKENKYFTRPNFFLPIAYVFALGLFFTDESATNNVLHRDQTNEMKGWMQLVILAYHYTGASQILPIYMFIRLLVSLFLFLSGFSHFTYFWNGGELIANLRFLQIIFRLNFLTICLCLCMNRPYQFYYFVPLITFWFVIMFVTFKIIPHVTSESADANSSHYFYIILKLITLFGVVTVLYTSEVFFENIFLIRPWKALFVTTDDSIQEWWFRWKIDRYSVPCGMVFAFSYSTLKKYHLIHDSEYSYLFTPGISILSVLLSIIGLIFYIGFSFLCRDKADCNEIHPYISFVPIISFILLRNISNLLRSRFSLLFAWFGKISLELFICQYHIWLAADTHGILVLVPGYPVLNVVITSFIFVCVSHEIHQITNKFVQYLITNDWRYTLRNLAIILLFLVFGSSANVAEYIWIVGIVLLLLGGLLFVMGVTSIGLYYSREDKRKSEIEFINTEAYASSAASARSVQSTNINNIYLIE
ncbi:PREDICTED: CAS1 domain-containing protein 1-like [Rhagoletis zephyria]|uniref:CAS1 domain-containing protein 1-like n=1 Tax=Rhagoletis zephyria TaxID=28612 RepID=UPI00081133A6|nr:PREDICTED: CAS1 domain-containing protein 1-like [Rhagoletis zephyria]